MEFQMEAEKQEKKKMAAAERGDHDVDKEQAPCRWCRRRRSVGTQKTHTERAERPTPSRPGSGSEFGLSASQKPPIVPQAMPTQQQHVEGRVPSRPVSSVEPGLPSF